MSRVFEREESNKGLIDSRVELIQLLIPLGLEAVRDLLEQEVSELVGARYSRNDLERSRWGSNPGSVYLGDQKVSVRVPRVRDKNTSQEVELKSYQQLKDSGHFEEQVFRKLINGISSRNYKEAAEQIPETFGISKSSVSRKFTASTSEKLKQFFERDLSTEDIIAIFIDGKALRGTQIIIALGITMSGKKIPLGFIESCTENATVCKDFLQSLIDRGLNTEQGILVIIDGAKGLASAVRKVFRSKAIIQRCQWHKRENILSYLNKKIQEEFRVKLQRAYQQPTYDKAKSSLTAIRKELSLINEDAARSLDEGLEETLALHKLGIFNKMGRSFKTTNCIENLNRGISRYVSRVCKWKNSDQRRRWVASALLEMEPNLKVVEGYKQLPLLRSAMKSYIAQLDTTKETKLAA